MQCLIMCLCLMNLCASSFSSVVLPGQTLVKTWTLENVGTEWPEGSKLVFVQRHANRWLYRHHGAVA